MYVYLTNNRISKFRNNKWHLSQKIYSSHLEISLYEEVPNWSFQYLHLCSNSSLYKKKPEVNRNSYEYSFYSPFWMGKSGECSILR